MGVEHKDITESSVVIRNGKATIIGWQHSFDLHDCPGEEDCEELVNAREVLDISLEFDGFSDYDARL